MKRPYTSLLLLFATVMSILFCAYVAIQYCIPTEAPIERVITIKDGPLMRDIERRALEK